MLRTPKLLKVSSALAAKNIRGGTRTGRVHQAIYAVVLREHPAIVKIGQTSKWSNRRASYASWNLRTDNDGILDERVFLINEEYVDLLRLESAVLREMGTPTFGKEWFKADLETACRAIDRVMCEGGLSYCMLD